MFWERLDKIGLTPDPCEYSASWRDLKRGQLGQASALCVSNYAWLVLLHIYLAKPLAVISDILVSIVGPTAHIVSKTLAVIIDFLVSKVDQGEVNKTHDCRGPAFNFLGVQIRIIISNSLFVPDSNVHDYAHLLKSDMSGRKAEI